MSEESKVIYIARLPNWDYGETHLDRGQLLRLPDHKTSRDEDLIRLGYLEERPKHGERPVECSNCGAWFIDDHARANHGRRRHPRREKSPEFAVAGPMDMKTGEPSVLLDTEGDKEDRQLERETPLYLDKTKASRK